MTITETRAPEQEPPVCPFWCDGHDGSFALDDFTHMSTTGAVDLSDDLFADTSLPGKRVVLHKTVTVTVAQRESAAAHVLLCQSSGLDFEDKLTASEAVRLSVILHDHAEIVRANGDHLCWCDGLHQPGDDHFGEFKNVGLELNERRGDQIATMLFREWKGEKSYVRMVWSDERHEADMTPDEADQVAALLRRHGAHAAGNHYRAGPHPEHPERREV
ncbi:MAG: hypothetical protein JWO67_2686 [Streptosporangiaceae bacterium]|nr:hypothetical protein [Streptosporangiaceae bacterium]